MVSKMYKEMYSRWLAANLDDPDLKPELESIQNDDAAIQDRFAVALKFGTAGLRGVIGAGTNRMNVYVVRQATQGLANWVKTQGGTQTVAISYDSRIKSDVFAKETAAVLAANGIKAYIYPRLEPTPALSWAVRYYGCGAGVCVTASHNPAKYNGYKVYGADGCQITLEVAAKILAAIEAVDCFAVQPADFDAALAEGKIEYSSEKCLDDFVDAVYAQRVGDGAGTADLKLVYTPLNGSGLECVKKLLAKLGVTHVTVVPEQEKPDGNFPTCPYPNPEIKEALACGLKLCETCKPDLLLATDPDADRVGIAVPDGNGGYALISGNEMGAMLFEYICASRTQMGTMPKNPVVVKTIVTTDLVRAIAKEYGVEVIEVLTGFKFIGEQIGFLEKKGEESRYVFGFEESYGYLAGPYVRDKDAIIGSMLICEMAAYYRAKGSSIKEELERIYAEYGRYLNKVDSFEFPGLSGMDKMVGIMSGLRENPPKDFGGDAVVKVVDYKKPEETGLPAANVLIYTLASGCTVVVRPSGTEPKIKTYFTTKGKDLAEAEAQKEKLAEACKPLLA